MFSLNEIKGLKGKKWEKFKNTLLTLSLAVTAGSLMQNLKLLSGNLCTASAKRIYKTADCPHIIIRFLLSLKEMRSSHTAASYSHKWLAWRDLIPMRDNGADA